MLDSSFDPVVKQLSREYAEGVGEKSRLEDKLEKADLSDRERKELRTEIYNLNEEILDKQEKLRSRL